MPHNLLTLVFDGLQPAFLGPYGNTWVATPAWNRLAAESLLLERLHLDRAAQSADPAISQIAADFTTAAWAGFPAWLMNLPDDLESLYTHCPPVSGPAFQPRPSLSSNSALLWQKLRAAGYHTLLITDEPAVLQLPAASEFVEQLWLELPLPATAASDWTGTQLAQIFATLTEALAAAPQPWAVWLHTGSLLRTWDAPYEMRGALADEDDPDPPRDLLPPRGFTLDPDPDLLLGCRQSYAAQIQVLDECLAAFSDNAAQLSATAAAWWLLLSSGGYPLAEHGVWGRTPPLPHRELTSCVGMLRPPRGFTGFMPEWGSGAGERLVGLTQPCDIRPTLEQMLAAPLPASDLKGETVWPAAVCGQSWLDGVAEVTRPLRDRQYLLAQIGQAAMEDNSPQEKGGRETLGVSTEHWRYWRSLPTGQQAELTTSRLYVHPDDDAEVNNVVDRCPAEVAACDELCTQWQERRTTAAWQLPLAELPPVLHDRVQ
ncbi:MAG: hypothetical protein SFX18_02045 [Pirellulales bacterium]|nr:hypothetical protein [Pirellulales bacterium]